MKQRVLLYSLTMMLFTACHSNQLSEKETAKDTTVLNRQFSEPVNKFAGIQFASQKDTSCGMPLKYGVEDTLHLNGNVYGFCSKECKDDFVKTLQTEHKR